MELREYTEYALQAALSLVAISSVYMVDPSNPRSFVFLLSFPLLFAYTAYISDEGFNRASLVSVSALGFLPLGGLFAPFSILVFTTNVLISLLGGGRSGRKLYSSVPLPLLISGLVLGSILFVSVTSSPGEFSEFRNDSAEAVGEGMKKTIETTGIVSSSRDAQLEMVRSVSSASVVATEGMVFNETQGNLGQDDLRSLDQAFSNAESEVPEEVVQRMNSSSTATPDIGVVAESAVSNLLTPKTAAVIVPFVALGVYGVHPLVGLLTAIIGVLIRGVDTRLLGEE
jgi:hypothetical protein